MNVPFSKGLLCVCALLSTVLAPALHVQAEDPVVLTTPTVIIEGPYPFPLPETVEPVFLTTPTVIIEGPYPFPLPETVEPVFLTTPTVIIEGPYPFATEVEDDFESEEVAEDESLEDDFGSEEFAEDEIEEENEEVEEAGVEEEVINFVAELVAIYQAQDVDEFGSLVSEDYREMRTVDEARERLDYDALIDAVRYEVDVAGAFQIKHRILGVRSGKNGVRVRLQWGMRFEDAQSGERKSRKGVTGLGLAYFEGWQLVTQRGDPLFGAITSESQEDGRMQNRRPDPVRRKRSTGRGG
jgi:hypothetical protein